MRNQRSNGLATFVVCGIIILIGCLLTGVIQIPLSKSAPQPTPSLAPSAKGAIMEYLSLTDSKQDSRDWWMKVVPPPSLGLADALSEGVSNITTVISRARHISPRTEEIAREYQSFFTSVYENGHARVTTRGTISPEDLKGKMEVCFFAMSDYQRHPSILYYNENWNAVMMGSLRWPEAFFAGVLFHELNHALLKRERGSLPPQSDAWFMEEIMCHELEATIINSFTTNRYFAEIDAILDRNSGVTSYDELLPRLRAQDFATLDKIIGAEHSGAFIRGTSCAQHLMTLGMRLVGRNHGTEKDKIALYKIVRARM